MLSSNNFVNLIGNLGSAPVAKTLPSGRLLTEFSLATNDRYTDANGNRVERTEWHTVKAFGKPAEILSQYLQRGSKVSILGTLRYNKWQDKYEQNRISTEVIVESFRFLDGNPASRSQPQAALTGEPMPVDGRTAARRAAAKPTVTAANTEANTEANMPATEEPLPF